MSGRFFCCNRGKSLAGERSVGKDKQRMWNRLNRYRSAFSRQKRSSLWRIFVGRVPQTTFWWENIPLCVFLRCVQQRRLLPGWRGEMVSEKAIFRGTLRKCLSGFLCVRLSLQLGDSLRLKRWWPSSSISCKVASFAKLLLLCLCLTLYFNQSFSLRRSIETREPSFAVINVL